MRRLNRTSRSDSKFRLQVSKEPPGVEKKDQLQSVANGHKTINKDMCCASNKCDIYIQKYYSFNTKVNWSLLSLNSEKFRTIYDLFGLVLILLYWRVLDNIRFL